MTLDFHSFGRPNARRRNVRLLRVLSPCGLPLPFPHPNTAVQVGETNSRCNRRRRQYRPRPHGRRRKWRRGAQRVRTSLHMYPRRCRRCAPLKKSQQIPLVFQMYMSVCRRWVSYTGADGFSMGTRRSEGVYRNMMKIRQVFLESVSPRPGGSLAVLGCVTMVVFSKFPRSTYAVYSSPDIAR